ncbi:MAG: hypothetical protein UR89_C0031G0001 [Candidatus Roizmanbacteria bacterium GW2011_GWA2_35_8]|uniref:Uncharacterized protein n=1 Tax=Candidatus Roizmanbacteria bacterium GW2011_GWA2_35_8 TaxID=1618479 RepID=A0A0G0CYQ7_9BACT|nr:MAG: hypothetical protein UR89_C0031G0001 [Candidatus Roizmanbacteria bacterium GW2011_GWA2_35_8]
MGTEQGSGAGKEAVQLPLNLKFKKKRQPSLKTLLKRLPIISLATIEVESHVPIITVAPVSDAEKERQRRIIELAEERARERGP